MVDNVIFDIYERLNKEYGQLSCPLYYKNNFQLMISVMLSAQCTDKAVNRVAPVLYKKFPNPESLAKADLTELEKIIQSLGLYKNKAKNIKASSKMLVEVYNGIIPDSIEELVKFPGIGRKTANVIIAHAFNKPGFPVDTHVKRLLNRIGVVSSNNPYIIEKRIRKICPEDKLSHFSLLLIRHGRECCNARKPKCDICVIANFCRYNNLDI